MINVNGVNNKHKKIDMEYANNNEDCAIKIITEYLIKKYKNVKVSPSTKHQDLRQNSDFVAICDGKELRIAYKTFRTLSLKNKLVHRYSRPTGTKTEFSKMKEGWGNLQIQLYEDKKTNNKKYEIYDLDSFRTYLNNNEDVEFFKKYSEYAKINVNYSDNTTYTTVYHEGFNEPPILLEKGTYHADL